jgi:FtsZ-binding cell division protein ZapB
MKKTKDNDQLSLDGSEEGEILQRLSEKVERAVSTIQELRRERDALKTRLEEAEKRLAEGDAAAERAASLEEDCDRYQRERGEIRTRIESILSNLEALEE